MARKKKIELDKLSTIDVAYKADSEGLGYAIQYYMSGASIADPALAAKWDACAKLLKEIDAILEAALAEAHPDEESETNEEE